MDQGNRWLEKLTELNEHKDKVKKIKLESDDMCNAIMEDMSRNGIDTIKLDSGIQLVLKERVTYASINKDYILETLKPFYNNVSKTNDLAEKTTEELMNNRSTKTNKFLKIMKQ